jgi:hypothetical protein
MNPQLIRAVARSSRQDLAADVRAGRRAALLRADPILRARLVRSILFGGGFARQERDAAEAGARRRDA